MPEMSLFEEVIACTILLFIVGSFQLVAAATGGCAMWWYVTGSRIPIYIIIALYSTLVVPVWPSDVFSRARVWKYVHKYFDYRKIVSLDPKPGRKYMVVEYPHGVFPLATILMGTYIDEIYLKYMDVQKRKPRAMVASVLFYIPWVRVFMSYLGGMPATEANFKRSFDTASHATVLPGGIAEMFMTSNTRERIYLKKRYGYIKMALKNGADILPLFHLGQSQILSVKGDTGFLRTVSRKMKMSLMFPYGRFFLPIPYRRRVVSAFGEPVVVPKPIPNPTRAQIQEYQDKIAASIQAAYDKYRHLVGWQDRDLSIE